MIREFSKYLPAFVRLNFVTEWNDKGHYFGQMSTSLLGYMHQIMQDGINLGNRHLEFLSYSNSQLKNHSCWFLCRNDDEHRISQSQIEAYMGNFSHEKNILKKFARRGQCFSTSKKVCELKPDQLTCGLADIERNGYIFTDGVGYISPELALRTAQMFNYSQVSAFQIRLAGAKGVLMVKPELEGIQIQLRKSQIKF